MSEQITGENFGTKVLENNLPVLVDFYADWCGPCMALAPTIDEVASEFEGKACVYKINCDDNKEVSMQYKVRSIPTLLFFKSGELKDRIVGAVPKDEIVGKLNSLN